MRKKIFLLLLFCSFIIIGAILNINVTVKQGINYHVYTTRIPLFLKIVDFIDRHYHYKQLIKSIVYDGNDKQERIMKIFAWTHKNIRKQPEALPVIDDHVWNIIVRGYGVADQSSDVFTTLCNYAGAEAFFSFIFNKNKNSMIPLSFVKLNSRWSIFDPYYGVYFKNNDGILADTREIKERNYKLRYIEGIKNYTDYEAYFENIPDNISVTGLERAQIQSPFRRFIFEVKKWTKIKQK